ncbi:uncharacterized protein LOC129911815 isoform X2 [Episyrphus balteatus]|uniref:uncharacterized protein LOC129911815 isoform X2 n=1 Tax=Episyrphus balteatus TaxID=286459 RepID=UPI0024858DF7|nr:uncharacterized protein LOC129911815 isoform X2 [Episyrphus balteatus]
MSCAFVVNIFLLLMFIQFGVKAKNKVDEQKLKEIADLRKELITAFEKDIDMKTSGGSGVVVQPGWTQGGDINKGSSKVVVTKKNLEDAAAIRHEIQSAINSNTYVKGEEISKADQYFGMQFRSKSLLANLIGSENSNFHHEEVGFGMEEELEEGMPNVVQSNAFDDIGIETLDRLKTSTRRTREVLVLQEIIEDLSFDLGEDVREWKHFEHDGKEYFIGLRETDLLIVEKNNMKYANSHVVKINAPILYLECFCFWNKESQRQDGMILAAVGENVLWYQANSDALFWKWSTGMPINGLTYFKIDQEEYLAISSDMSARTEFSSLNIYQFDIRSKEFWIVQKLQLEDSCSETIFLDSGRDVVLAVVQNNSAAIFVFNPHTETLGNQVKFELKTVIESEGIQSISGFQMGGLSYLALGGLAPQILHYSRGEFLPKTIFGQNFGLVELFLPISTRTYRDDLILLVQHRVSFDSHDLVVLEALIWNGEVFEATIPAPCVIGNHTFAFGVGCMLDIHRENGIKGSAVLRRNNDVFIIVPRYKAESGFFQIKTELLSKNSELVDLGEIFTFLKEWVKEQESLIEESYKYLQDSSDPMESISETLNFTSLKTPELDFNGPVGEIFINEHQWTEDDTHVDLEKLIGAIERLDMELNSNNEDITRNRRHLTYETLDFDNIEADEVELQLLNGEHSYVKNSELIFPGTVSFQSLNVLDEIQLSSARSVRESSMEVGANLKFETINDIRWNDFVDDLIFRNIQVNIGELEVLGEVISEGTLDVHNIGVMKFPEDFLWSSSQEALVPIVEGEKYFRSNLVSGAVDTGGPINGINPFDMITLSENENIAGLTTFRHLEVSEKMAVNGTPQGKGLTAFLSNPTLLESNIIQSACNFFQLEVKGSIHVSEKFNGNDLDLLLNDIIYQPSVFEAEILIPSKKFLNSPNFFDSKLKLNENILNKIELDTFVTKNTQQKLNLKKIMGNIYFNSLTVTGFYDSVNIIELKRDTLLIDEDRFVDNEIEFTKKISAQSVNIIESLNGDSEFKTCKDDVHFKEVVFKTVQAQTLTSQCDIIGSGILNGFDLKQPTKNQSSTLFIEELILSNGLQVESLHNTNAKSLLSFLEKIDNIPAMILEGKIFVEKIHVDGDIQVNKFNSFSFDEDIQMTAIWLNRPNFLRTKLEFHETLVVHGNLNVNGSLNSFNLPSMISDMAFKSESLLLIRGPKDFLADLSVIGDIVIASVNKLDLTEIATKQTIELFQGILEINGDLMVDDLEVTEFLNNFPVGNFAKTYRYDENLNTIVFVAEVTFEKETFLENLYILGKLNSIGNINEFFENIVYKNNICMLKGKTTFKGITSIEKGAYIKNVNGHNVAHLMRNIVFIDDPVPIVIFAPVSFKDVVQANDVTVKRSINTTNLIGCQLKGWLFDTLRKNKMADFGGLVKFGPGALDENSIHTVFLNGMDMDYVVTLYTSQNLSGNVVFSDVHLGNTINTVGLVNGIDLKQEMENTLLKSGKQHVTTPLTMQSCSVIQSLEINAINSNGINLQNLASLHENLEFSSPLSFSKIITRNVVTSDLISGIDFSEWQQKALLTKGQSNLVVTGNWKIKDLNVKSHSITGDSPKSRLMQINNEIHDQYDQLYESFGSLCEKSMKLVEDASKKIYFPKYLEKSFVLEENEIFDKVFLVTDRYEEYIIVNIGCHSKIFKWDTKDESLKEVYKFESGLLEDILAVPAKDESLHLVTNIRSNSNCSNQNGVTAWTFDRSNVSYLKNFNDLDISTIHHPANNGDTFYAIGEKNRKVFQLSANSNEKRSWNLPPSEKGLYRFLPNDANLGIALANGQQILLLNQPSRRRLRRRRHSVIGRHRVKYEVKPQPKLVGKQLSFSDFRQAIVRSLRDLIRRLNIQLTDVNYSLSEDEIQDEHLQNDFMAILQEIHNQKMLPSESFDPFCFEPTEFSSNLDQILAAKVVQVIWPVLVEIEEVHSHLRSNEHDHPTCSNIFNSLSSVVNEVLQIASEKNRTDISDATNLKRITGKIQEFQKRILRTIDDLQETASTSTDEQTDKPPSSGEAPVHVHLLDSNKTVVNPLEEPFIGQAITGRNLLATDSPYLPARGSGEIISIKTGMSGNYRTLIAVTEPKDHVIAGETDSVKIFFDVITGSLFQTLSAYKPSCLSSTRVQDESLLAFVEDKNTVRVLIYKGIQGFVELVKLKTKDDVFGLQFISLGEKRGNKLPKTFLIVSGGNKVQFYELLMFGDYWFGSKINCDLWKNH